LRSYSRHLADDAYATCCTRQEKLHPAGCSVQHVLLSATP
jgi:hypothetical protein